jgi:hypothetical protein
MYVNNPSTTITGALTAASINNIIYNVNDVLSIGANVDKSKLYIYNSDTIPNTKSGLTIHQDASTSDAHLQLNAYGTKNTIGIDQSDGYKFKIARGPHTDPNSIVILDPNYVAAATAVATWTLRTSAADNTWNSVCWSPELRLFAAVAGSGTGNRVMTSSDSTTWTIRTSAADNTWQSVCWSPELRLFVAVAITGTGNRVMTSPDGITWTIRTSAADNSWMSVCWSPELYLFVAVSQTGSGNRVMTSPNGITWTIRTSAVDNQWQSVCWSSELRLFVAVSNTGTANRVMTSPNGITWTTRSTTDIDYNWQSVCWSPELRIFCAVGALVSGNNIMTSPDGFNWTLRTSSLNNDWRSMCWSSELKIFVAVANAVAGDRIMTSPNGAAWTTRTSTLGNGRSICWSPELGTFCAVGQSGTGNRVMTSANMYSNAPNITAAGIRGKTTGVADAINVVIDSTGQLGTTSSSITKKHNVRDMLDFTNRIHELNPVIFKWKPEICQDQTDQYGLIAEHTAEVFPELAVKDPNDTNYLTVAYQNIPVMLVNELKKIKAMSNEIDDKVTMLGI